MHQQTAAEADDDAAWLEEGGGEDPDGELADPGDDEDADAADNYGDEEVLTPEPAGPCTAGLVHCQPRISKSCHLRSCSHGGGRRVSVLPCTRCPVGTA